MNRLYQKTFDHVRMPEDRAQALRGALASRCPDTQTEVIAMNKKTCLRRPALLFAAVLLIAALSLSALACGGYVVYQVVTGKDAQMPENGTTYELTEPVEVMPYEYTEQDGQIYVSFDAGDWENVD